MAANKISQAERERLEAAFPGLPKSYFDHLRHAGWGETKNGRMLYSGPVAAEEIYGASNELDTILLTVRLLGFAAYHRQRLLYSRTTEYSVKHCMLFRDAIIGFDLLLQPPPLIRVIQSCRIRHQIGQGSQTAANMG